MFSYYENTFYNAVYVTISWELLLATWQLSRQAAFSISFSGSFQWKSESRFATRSTVEDSRFRGTDDEKEAMNSVIGQQTASPTSSPSWLPLCLSLIPSLDLLLRVSLPFLLSLCLLLFPITRHTHAYVCSIREVTLLQGTLDRELLDASSGFLARKSGGIMPTAWRFLAISYGRILGEKR